VLGAAVNTAELRSAIGRAAAQFGAAFRPSVEGGRISDLVIGLRIERHRATRRHHRRPGGRERTADQERPRRQLLQHIAQVRRRHRALYVRHRQPFGHPCAIARSAADQCTADPRCYARDKSRRIGLFVATTALTPNSHACFIRAKCFAPMHRASTDSVRQVELRKKNRQPLKVNGCGRISPDRIYVRTLAPLIFPPPTQFCRVLQCGGALTTSNGQPNRLELAWAFVLPAELS
jgi:hypothetical protein